MKRHHNGTMQDRAKFLITALCSVALSTAPVSWAQTADGDSGTRLPVKSPNLHTSRYRTLSKNDRSAVVAVALHSKKARIDGRDCSHLVHSIYQNAGFPYDYGDSEDLYDGMKGFQRVAQPEPADLVVWHGHVGIVIRPQRHQFFSMLSSGPGVDDYRSHYWKTRGQPRFYRYVKSDS
jgi:cell wall-associated NlpC family hydrolase